MRCMGRPTSVSRAALEGRGGRVREGAAQLNTLRRDGWRRRAAVATGSRGARNAPDPAPLFARRPG